VRYGKTVAGSLTGGANPRHRAVGRARDPRGPRERRGGDARRALLEIGNAKALEVVVELLSADAVKVNLGTRVDS
jgi:hypothetical protein